MSAWLFVPDVGAEQQESVIGRTNPLVKLGIAIVWLLGLGLTVDVRPPLALLAVALASGVWLGAIPQGVLGRRIAPFAVAAVAIAVTNLLFSGHNTDPLATELFRIGPLRVTAEAVAAAAGLGARIAAIVSIGAVFTLTTDVTRLIDSMVQLGRVSPRFAYGALAAYQAVPKIVEDLATLRGARRLRGLREWDPRLLVGLLVRAIRHADQLAIAMDARGFGSGPRTTYRPVAWTQLDAVVAGSAAVILLMALILGR
ncbi:MAG TPA: energy-coupling factor transporter transmembrane component T [Candidatus Dormibacteraeota bacterium]|nr:energy-coupling factor transporter transmembrane component T [Candidatus Dormibacteraeota bacterium]